MEEVSLLFRASENGDLATVKHLVEELRIDPQSWRDGSGRTPLHSAAVSGHLDTVRYFVEERSCDMTCRDESGSTPLHVAALGGKLDTVQYLICEPQNCDPICRDWLGRTPLHRACENGNLDVVKYFTDDGMVDPSTCRDENDSTPLHMAAKFGTLEVVKYLTEKKGCDVMHMNKSGNTSLHEAALGGKLDTLQYLICERGCEAMCRYWLPRTPLHSACENGHLDIVKYLIDDLMVDPSCRDGNDSTPLHVACATGQLSVVRLLVEKYMCDPGLGDKWGNTPSNIALQNRQLHVTSYLSDIEAAVSTDRCRELVASLKRNTRKACPTGWKLASGTYGSVIELVSAGEVVAGKVFKTISTAHMQAVLDKLYGEIFLMMEIHHPNIVESRGVCFLVNHPLPVLLMERMMCSLHAYLLDPSHHAVELTSKVSILCDVASGLSYLHSHTPAIIHRDLTAKNVLLDSNLKAKIGGFGNARRMDLDPECSPEAFTSLPGTLEYMPPEAQGKHTRYNPSLDVFSFGHLALLTITQSHVDLLPCAYSDGEGVHAHFEVKRREKSFNSAEQMLGANHSLVVLIKSCLCNNPAQRPDAELIMTRLQQVKSVPLDAKPTIKQLCILKTKSGNNIDIKTALAADWKNFGYLLEFDDDGRALDLIEKECGRSDPVACYQKMMAQWLRGKGAQQPANWRTLLRLLREFEECGDVLAKKIEDALNSD